MITRASQAIWRRPWGVHGTGLWTHLPAAQLVVHSGFGLNMYELCPHQCPTALHTAPLPSGRGESYGSHSRILSGTPRETAGCWHRQQTACRAVFPFDSKVTVTALRVSARLPPSGTDSSDSSLVLPMSLASLHPFTSLMPSCLPRAQVTLASFVPFFSILLFSFLPPPNSPYPVV